MIKARVIRIISAKQLILNVGSDDGVSKPMKFAIFSPTIAIIDPDTGEQLGTYRDQKVAVEVDRVFERFTIASRPIQYDDEGFYGDDDEPPGTWPDLPVEHVDIDPLPTGATVRVGDDAEQVPPLIPAEFIPADDSHDAATETEDPPF